MAAITVRDGRYLVRVRKKGFKPVSKTFSRRADGLAWARGVEVAMESGRWVDEAMASVTVPTLAEAIKVYRDGRGGMLKGAKTYAFWLTQMSESWLGALSLDDITPAHVSKWRDGELLKGLKPGSVVRKLGLMSGLFTWCIKDQGWIEVNPLSKVRKPQVNDARDRTLSEVEMSFVRRASETSRAAWLPDALVVLVRSAMRRGELWGLRIKDVDFTASTAHLTDTKNGSARDVPLCGLASESLRRLVEAARDRAQHQRRVVTHKHITPAKARTPAIVRGSGLDDGDGDGDGDGVRLIPVSDPAAMSLAFRRTLVRARRLYRLECESTGAKVDPSFLSDFRLHDLRHQAVSTWAATGAFDVLSLMAISGHKTPRMLSRYTHLKPSNIAQKMSSLAVSA